MIGDKNFTAIRNNNSGLTLMEMLTAIAAFSVLIISLMSIAKSVIDGQRLAIASQNTQESLRFALEVMSKEARNALRSDDSCKNVIESISVIPAIVSDSNNKVYNSANSATVLYFQNKDEQCVAYLLNADRLKIFRDLDKDSFVDGHELLDITPDDISINNLKFSIADNTVGSPNSLQPRATISLEAEMLTVKQTSKEKIHIQTAVSSRNYQ